MKTQLENALAFANNNVKVFPLSYNSKRNKFYLHGKMKRQQM